MGGRNCFYDKKMVNYKDEYTKFKLFNRFASAFRRLSAIAYGKGTGRAARITLQMTDGELKKKLSVPAGCRDLNEYLTKFEFPLTLMQTPEALEKCMHDLLTELEGQGVQYCEVRFAPQLHTQKGMSQNEVIEAVKAGLYSVAGVKPESIHAGIILCCMRGSDNGQQNKITVEEAARHLGSGVCAVDLAGAEAIVSDRAVCGFICLCKAVTHTGYDSCR